MQKMLFLVSLFAGLMAFGAAAQDKFGTDILNTAMDDLKITFIGHGSLMFADDHLIVLGDEGELVLVEVSPEAYREKGRVQLFEGRKTWTVPTLSDGRLFVRDEKEMVALKVTK